MLHEVCATNLALIEEARVEFAPGLNVLTGETGVGKSLLIGALSLLLGGRASAEQVRSGAKQATVDGVLDAPETALCSEIGEIVGEELHEEELLITRTVDAGGRSRCRLNGRPITVGMLREIGRKLIEIHGQQDHENLLQPSQQRLLLDRFADTETLRSDFEALFRAAHAQRDRRDRLVEEREDRQKRIELLRHELEEIDAAELQPDEEKELAAERALLANAESIERVATSGYAVIYEAEGSLTERLKAIARELDNVAELDPKLKEAQEAAEQGLVQLEELAFTLREYRDRLEFDPQGLDRIEGRLDLIHKLKAKHGASITDVLARRDEIARELDELAGENEELSTAADKLQALIERMCETGRQLSLRRTAAAKDLAGRVATGLTALGMRNGRFEIAVSQHETEAGEALLDVSSPSGLDTIEFMISPNVGEDLRPLRKIASGGEMSRIMLALKHSLVEADRTPLLIFDEIDANVGGRIGRVIGEKLRDIARSHQVFCVTHLPQIASYADEQYRVTKEVVDGRTRCRVEKLEGEARIREIAQMIRGDRSSRITLEQAREMLEDARKRK